MDMQSTDVSGAFGAYLKAVNDERLSKVQLDRSQLLYQKGAVPQSQVEIAQDAEDDAKAALSAAEDQLRVLGVDKDHPSAIVKVYAPASGYIIAQNVTNAAAAGVTYAGSPNAFTIADLSHVWIICDVYENDLPTVHLGQKADIRLTAYPDRVLTGVISDIGAVLDPQIRTAKVRIQVDNPDTLMRVGMFATATIHGKTLQTHAQVPATAVLHLHDRDWVYVPASEGQFRRVSVRGGNMLPGNMQEILSGINAGQQVVSNALALQNTADQ
jgi:cobalt-zinc-cadmium efflux system membrane fusion protein